MKLIKKIFNVMFTVVCAFSLAACENSSQNSKDDSTNVNSKDKVSNTDNSSKNRDNMDPDEKEDTSPTKDEDSSTTTTDDLQEMYLKKLNDTKSEMEKVEAEDTSTYALKKVENDRYDVWDELLNEVYGVLKEQLTTEEMGQLRKEQRNWITYRDDSALEASLKFKGGTMEHLEYVAVLANLTEERCFALVDEYMK